MKSIYKLSLALVALLFIMIYCISSSEPLMKVIAQYRYQLKSPFGSDKYTYGDLYGLTYLPQFKMKQSPNGDIGAIKSNRDINLYAVVDSHIFSFVKSDSVFYGVKKYWFGTWNDYAKHEYITINNKQKNILMLEIVEYNVRLMADTNYVYNKLTAVNKPQIAKPQFNNGNASSYADRIKNAFFDKKINENLEFTLFGYNFLAPLKELKASINYNLFNRIDKDVMLSTNKQYLYLKSTADTAYESSYYPTPQYKINNIVTSLNHVYDHYKAIGFDEVYFIMIPNPTTILEPRKDRYNYLIPRIQYSPDLKMKYIDLYDVYKKTTLQVYKKSDTHYTNAGYKLLIQELNKKLKAEQETQK